MELLKDRRVVIGGGVAVALLAGLVLALALQRGEEGPAEPPPASETGLVVNVGRDDEFKAKNPMRCFVGGQYVGDFLLAECARRNGVATTALDVGIDETGALAAAESFGDTIMPLPPPAVAAPALPVTTLPVAPSEPAAPRVPVATCQRYERGWQSVGELSLNACVQQLFAGRCERPGGAAYGIWGGQSLRLVPGRVETSSDDRNFRLLVEQGPGCSVPPV